ncbi:hypothetical protein [Vibrio alginolyticus]|uniref:hypothetical protein n=1 Tax=Vibrio alginolyticus TaxID=663 RepID=UPI003D0A033B
MQLGLSIGVMMTANLAKVIEISDDSVHQGDVLGIDKTVFRDSIQSGIYQFKSVSKFHPITAGGSRAWEEIVAAFRETVISENNGWKAVHEHGMPLLINPSKQLTIVITSGDINTGLNNGIQPKTRNQKGTATQDLVNSNYALFEDVDGIDILPSSADSHQTWVFLYTIDKTKSEVRYEMSLPTETSLSGAKGKVKISSWQERIIFEPLPFDDIQSHTLAPTFTDDSDFFDPVKK